MNAPPIGRTSLKMWRLVERRHAECWDSGGGASENGSRWNPAGFPAVYCALDAATTILEVAAHVGFDALDTEPYVMSCACILDAADVHTITEQDLPNPAWLYSGHSSKGQQTFGRRLLESHAFLLVPAIVHEDCRNLVFNPHIARGRYVLLSQKAFALDPRLNPPTRPPEAPPAFRMDTARGELFSTKCMMMLQGHSELSLSGDLKRRKSRDVALTN